MPTNNQKHNHNHYQETLRLVASFALTVALAYLTWPLMPLFGVAPVTVGGRRVFAVSVPGPLKR